MRRAAGKCCAGWSIDWAGPVLGTPWHRPRPKRPSKGGTCRAGEGGGARPADGSARRLDDDEHRVGLKPILRRVWHKQGQQPIAPCRPRYQWLYEYAFVHPITGETFWLLLPTVSTALFAQALAQFTAALGVGPTFQIVLVLDQAGWHRSHELVVPDGLTLVFLPPYSPYSPELQPAEPLWASSDEPLANRVFASLDDLLAVRSERCRYLQAYPDLVAGRAHFHWWPDSLRLTVA